MPEFKCIGIRPIDNGRVNAVLAFHGDAWIAPDLCATITAAPAFKAILARCRAILASGDGYRDLIAEIDDVLGGEGHA